MTKVAFACPNLDVLRDRLAISGHTTTRFLPKRHTEMVGGSLFWIMDHALVARSEITGFDQPEAGGRWAIRLSGLIPVQPRARRAHQGWRYLEAADAPPDLAAGELAGAVLPGKLLRELARLGLD
ncbi:DUF1489 family protein [Croceibacterium sp. TMG7-5b_MA50]|uniref:DUF1489 family protein n=1 Tax=Croceibacterium sp. TMG7-5b_MA50 TaxID=3121290 RepID=UPI003221AEA4